MNNMNTSIDKMNNHPVLVLGGANLDFFIQGPRLPQRGESLLGHHFLQAVGGKGLNQAVAVSRLGEEVSFVGKIGKDDFGKVVKEKLLQEKIEIENLFEDEEHGTGVVLIHVEDQGEKQNMVDPRANLHLTTAEVDQVSVAIKNTKVLLLQLEVPLKSTQHAIALKRQAMNEKNKNKNESDKNYESYILLDLAPPQELPFEIYQDLTLMRANSYEAKFLTGISVEDYATARKAAQVFLQRGARSVMIDACKDGNLLMGEHGEFLYPRYKVEAKDTTGAGDALMGTMAALLAKGYPLPKACLYANAAAALATTKLGAQAGFPTWSELQDFLSNYSQ